MQPMLRLIVTGSQGWTNQGFVWLQLTKALRRANDADRGLLVVQGDCQRGPDRFAKQWAMEQMRWGAAVDVEDHPADWSRGLSGGFRRSEKMVRLGAWGILGFLADCPKPDCKRPRPHGSHGTTHCLRVAKKHGIPAKAWKTKGWRT